MSAFSLLPSSSASYLAKCLATRPEEPVGLRRPLGSQDVTELGGRGTRPYLYSTPPERRDEIGLELILWP